MMAPHPPAEPARRCAGVQYPAFPWLARNKVDAEATVAHMKALRKVGTPYSDEEIAKAPEMLANKSELDAVIAYLQGLGLALKNVR